MDALKYDELKHADKTLSIVIPVYNELVLLPELLARVEAAPLPGGLKRQIILVEDCSTDGTRGIVQQIEKEHPHYTVKYHPVNRGKGAALRTGFEAATGDYVIIQDADLEYDPNEYGKLLEPMLSGRADVVYGSRFSGGQSHRVLYFWHALGNRFLTLLSNMMTNLNLTDMEVCYKLFRREVLNQLALKEDRFGFEPEITAKLSQMGCRIYEVGISYAGRTYAEGKKINWKDGFRALYCITYYNLIARPNRSQPATVTKVESASADSKESSAEGKPESASMLREAV